MLLAVDLVFWDLLLILIFFTVKRWKMFF